MAATPFMSSITILSDAPNGRVDDFVFSAIAIADLPFSGTPSGSTFACGDGTWSNALPAANLTGTVADARLSANVPILVGGLLPTAYLPALAINDIFTVANQAAMLALTAQRGDMAIRTDLGATFVLSTDTPGTLADWKQLPNPTAPVSSVNGQTGIVVLNAANVGAQASDAALTALAGGSDFVQFAGPAGTVKVFTLPNTACNILTDAATLTLGQGGTGNTSFTAFGVVCGGTVGGNPLQSVASAGTAGQVLTSFGPGALPQFQTPAINIVGLTTADPALGDSLAIYDLSATANRQAIIDQLLALNPGTPGGRLTLASNVPVTTADVTSAGTVYYTPFRNDRITLWDGTRWVVKTFTQFSLALSGLASPRPYDVFCYLSGGTPALEFLAWTSDTARATAISIQDGRYCKSTDKMRLYLGTFYTASSSTTNDATTLRGLWNYYNRVRRNMAVYEIADSWTYGTNSWRPFNNSTLTRLRWVEGVAEDTVEVEAIGTEIDNNSSGAVGIGLDSTTTNIADLTTATFSNNSIVSHTAISKLNAYTGIGFHFAQMLEIARAGTASFSGDGGTPISMRSGIVGVIWG